MKTPRFLLMASFMASTSAATVPIDGRTAAGWTPQPGWSPGKAATAHSVIGREGSLVFSATGGVMSWTFDPGAEHLAGGKRYLCLRYRAQDIPPSGDYLLIAQDGSPGWRHYLTQRHLEPDGAEHVLAVDLLSLLPPDNIDRLAIRIGSADGRSGRLEARITFADDPPPGARVIGAPAGTRKTLRIEPESIEWQPSPSWVPRNAAETHSDEISNTGVRFRAAGEGRAMRWCAVKPPQFDTTPMPFLAMRYRASGRLAGGYAVQAHVVDPKAGRKSVHLVSALDLDTDGGWHVFRGRVDTHGAIESLAIGIDCGGPLAEIEIDWIAFDSQPPLLPVADLVEFQTRDTPWPLRKDGLEPLPPPEGEGDRLGPVTVARFGIGSWFPSTRITVGGIPFDVVPEPARMAASGLVEEDTLIAALPAGPAPAEILILLAAAFPHREETVHWKTQSPLRMLNEPERLVLSLENDAGAIDELLPIHAGKAQYGVGHDLAVYAIHPAPGSLPRRLALHDRMRNAGFAVLGVTLNRGAPRVPEPDPAPVWFPPVKKAPTADAAFRFPDHGRLAWGEIESPLFGGRIPLRERPLFSLRLADRDIPSTEWKIEKASARPDGGFTADCVWAGDGAALSARFEAQRLDPRSVLITLDLRNAGAAPVTGTLFFPKLDALALGSHADTWYLGCRTGGVINKIPCSWRDEIGEPHALPLDGFFSPRLGAGIAFMPRDLEGVFRWHHLRKDAAGGGYALEFLPQAVAPGEKWECVPVAVSAVPGDWRDQLAWYREWMRTWYRPSAPRKAWFARIFGFPSYTPTQPFTRPLDERIDLLGHARKIEENLGWRDYLHLFGWAITEEHGHWGAYDEYHQLGGLARFASEVRKCRAAGTPVGLYLDGYLVATQASKPDRGQREQWAVRTPEGRMLYHENYDAHSMCPYAPGWREHLTSAYRRVATEVKPDGMYLDEFGKCMTSRICSSTNHGHRAPMGMAAGEWTLSREVRAAIPPETAFYCEYVPADVACQHLDGAFGHTALHGFRDGYDLHAPHYINLQRFALPDFKVFELIFYSPLKNGNWSLLKYPFFNGEGYYMTSTYLTADPRARDFLRNAFRVQHEHADAFTSMDVEPLIPTLAPGLFANRFSIPKKTVWTLLNSTHRSLRGALLAVPSDGSGRYADAWKGGPIVPESRQGTDTLSFEIGPRQVGCIVRQ